ncbi:MAG: hypothetical protein ABSF61_12745 [Anaerolineales bacterium]|jgi:hypothetical protein
MRRTLPVTLLACGVFFFAAMNLVEAWQAWQNRSFMNTLGLPLPVAYWIARGGLWASAGLAATLGLWNMKRWGRILTLWLVPLYLLTWLSERLILGRSRVAELSLPFGLALLGLAAALVLVVLLHPKMVDRFSGS